MGGLVVDTQAETAQPVNQTCNLLLVETIFVSAASDVEATQQFRKFDAGPTPIGEFASDENLVSGGSITIPIVE